MKPEYECDIREWRTMEIKLNWISACSIVNVCTHMSVMFTSEHTSSGKWEIRWTSDAPSHSAELVRSLPLAVSVRHLHVLFLRLLFFLRLLWPPHLQLFISSWWWRCKPSSRGPQHGEKQQQQRLVERNRMATEQRGNQWTRKYVVLVTGCSLFSVPTPLLIVLHLIVPNSDLLVLTLPLTFPPSENANWWHVSVITERWQHDRSDQNQQHWIINRTQTQRSMTAMWGIQMRVPLPLIGHARTWPPPFLRDIISVFSFLPISVRCHSTEILELARVHLKWYRVDLFCVALRIELLCCIHSICFASVCRCLHC